MPLIAMPLPTLSSRGWRPLPEPSRQGVAMGSFPEPRTEQEARKGTTEGLRKVDVQEGRVVQKVIS